MTVADGALEHPAVAMRVRLSLAQKFALAFLGLVAAALIVNGAIDMVLTYRDALKQAARAQQEKADAASDKVVQFVTEIERQLGWTTRAEWSNLSVEQRRYDFIRLMRQAAAITDLVHVDSAGRQQLKLSRLEPDTVTSSADLSTDPRFIAALRDKIYYGPVTFRRGSEPYMTIAMAHAGRNPGVTIAEVNLKFAWDVVTAIRIGETGYAYIVDPTGRLIAHPDMSLVLRNTDLAALPQVSSAMANLATWSGDDNTRGPDGREVLSARARVSNVGWIVFVELPTAEAISPVWTALYRTLALLALGMVLASVAGTLLARRMVVPIRDLQAGAQSLGEGDLTQRIPIRTGDEIGSLAQRFNMMAGQIQASQETLERKVEARTSDLNAALTQQTATADILRVISASPTEVTPVFNAIAESAVRLCEGMYSAVAVLEDGMIRIGGLYNWGDEGGNLALHMFPMRANRDHLTPNAIRENRIIHQQNIQHDPQIPASSREMAIATGYQTILIVPMTRHGTAIGAIVTAKAEGPFSETQIGLIATFADQAVIAIENTRLFNETQEALVQQTATGKILQVIAASPTDIKPVLRAVAEKACEVCDASDSAVVLKEGDDLVFSAHNGSIAIGLDRWPINRNWATGRSVVDRAPVHVPDLMAPEAEEFSDGRELSIKMGHRAILSVPLLRDGEAIGAIVLRRKEPHPFTDKQIALLKTFADQAIIAINNVRLFEEVQERTHDLGEALDQQTATAEVLKVISRSAFNLPAVLEALLETAGKLCAAEVCVLFKLDGDVLRAGAIHGGNEQFVDFHLKTQLAIDRSTIAGRTVIEKRTIHVPDIEADLEYGLRQSANLGGWRSIIGVPLMREGVVLGALALARVAKGPFTSKQIELTESFADQAVIAIENSRLFEEVQARTKALQESLDYQTATSEVLGVISRSPNDVKPVLDAIAATALELCGALDCAVRIREGDKLLFGAYHGGQKFYGKEMPLARDYVAGRAVVDAASVQVDDLLAAADEYPRGAELAREMGFRTAMAVPLMREGVAIGCILVRRDEVRPFSPRQIELLRTFADQAVIAIENSRLFEEVQAKTRELETSLVDLTAAQTRLIQSEKLASLGQLTAGIAHEIKNPLNFVNNFADLSSELVEEIEEALAAGETVDPKVRDEVAEISAVLKANLAKIVQHGRRADSIVKNMLSHSRESGGERRMVDVNAIVEEALNLAYHGARAEKPGFNIKLERSFDPAVGQIELYPQEFTRVLLNLIGNGFYAANKKRLDNASDGFEPILRVTTKAYPDKLKLKIWDNGTGIPNDVKARIFEPFFTTKPTGDGTGLGLSLSHDIVVKQHGGKLDVITEAGFYTEFIVTLPREIMPNPSEG